MGFQPVPILFMQQGLEAHAAREWSLGLHREVPLASR